MTDAQAPSPPSRRNVPTLTNVVQHKGKAPKTPELVPDDQQQELVMRVMQRLDVALEKQLPRAVARLVVEHMQLLGPQLWDEVAGVVKKSVEQAVAQELGERRKP